MTESNLGDIARWWSWRLGRTWQRCSAVDRVVKCRRLARHWTKHFHPPATATQTANWKDGTAQHVLQRNCGPKTRGIIKYTQNPKT